MGYRGRKDWGEPNRVINPRFVMTGGCIIDRGTVRGRSLRVPGSYLELLSCGSDGNVSIAEGNSQV
jgi:hypothetical protein